jgi:hypothetical protein
MGFEDVTEIRHPLFESGSGFLKHETEADGDNCIDEGLDGVNGNGNFLTERQGRSEEVTRNRPWQ